jgi:hypothetical protein
MQVTVSYCSFLFRSEVINRRLTCDLPSPLLPDFTDEEIDSLLSQGGKQGAAADAKAGRSATEEGVVAAPSSSGYSMPFRWTGPQSNPDMVLEKHPGEFDRYLIEFIAGVPHYIFFISEKQKAKLTTQLQYGSFCGERGALQAYVETEYNAITHEKYEVYVSTSQNQWDNKRKLCRKDIVIFPCNSFVSGATADHDGTNGRE